ncbi:MAG TPA: mandelate racemase [Planctomycetota bacterium]
MRLRELETSERELRLRMPFRFGVLTLESCRQIFVRVRAEIDGRDVPGVASEVLLPKWFDKSPDKTEAENVDDLRRSISDALPFYQAEAPTAYALHVPAAARAAAASNPLVAGFGVALLDRALLDALCRARGLSFFEAIRRNLPGTFLRGFDMDGFLASLKPKVEIAARHTVGLLDPLTRDEIQRRPPDDLPCSLDEAIEAYGLRYFKIKISGRIEADLARLTRIAAVLDRLDGYQATLDGNEQYKDAEAVVELWDRLAAQLPRLAASILFIEQPIARGVARAVSVAALAKRRPVEIDESDDTADAFVWARELGYAGVSSKSCKGVYRSLLNRARVERWGAPHFMSAEDLVVQPGISLQQDLSLAAIIGCAHVERNGHHYVDGRAFATSDELERRVKACPRLYRPDGRLEIRRGMIDLRDLDTAGFGSQA